MEATNKEIRYELSIGDSMELNAEILRQESKGWREASRHTASPECEGRPIVVTIEYEPMPSKEEIDKSRDKRDTEIRTDIALYGYAWIRISYANHYENKGSILKERFDPTLIRITQPK